MSDLTVLFTFGNQKEAGKIAGLTDDSVVVSKMVSGKNKVLFVPKNGGESTMLDPYPDAFLTVVNAFGDYALVQSSQRRSQTSFLISKTGQVVALDKGKLVSRPNIFAARIDEGGVYGDIRNSSQVSNTQWDFAGNIVVSASLSAIAGTLNNLPIMSNMLVENLPSDLGGSMALSVSNGWVLGRAFEKNPNGTVKKATGASVSWIWNLSEGLKVCSMPDNRKLSVTAVSFDGRFVVGLAWVNDVVGQESVILDMQENKVLSLDAVAGCEPGGGGGADWSSAKFDMDGALYVRRTKTENANFEVVKVTNLA